MKISFSNICRILTMMLALPLALADTCVEKEVDNGNGHWGMLFQMEVIPIHAKLLLDGQVLVYGTNNLGQQGATESYSVWDARTGKHRQARNHHLFAHNTSVNIFCSTMSIDASTGKVLVIGGDDEYNNGVADVTEFDPDTLQLRNHPAGDMHYARWYPTSIVLPDGRVFVIGGKSGTSPRKGNGPDTSIAIPEVWAPATGWRALPGAAIPEMATWVTREWYYPHAYVNSKGEIICIFGRGKMDNVYKIDLKGNGSRKVIGNKPFRAQKLHPSIMYRKDKILMMADQGELWEIDISDGDKPVFNWKLSTGYNRINGVFALLPDGRVVVTGGNLSKDLTGNKIELSVLSIQIWDPATDEFYTGPNQTLPRLYHSTSLILPDSTIFSAGGGAPGPLRNTNGQIYVPGYLYNRETGAPAQRPNIGEWPANIRAGENFTFTVDHAEDVARVTMTKPGSTTHAHNCQARWLELSFEIVDDTTIRVFDVPNRNVLLPGVWLLNVINSCGVPSTGKLMAIGIGNPRVQLKAVGGCAQLRLANKDANHERPFLDDCDESLAWEMESIGHAVLLRSPLNRDSCLQKDYIESEFRMRVGPCDPTNKLQNFVMSGDYTSMKLQIHGDTNECAQFRGGFLAPIGKPIIVDTCHENKAWELVVL